jgi:DNA primase
VLWKKITEGKQLDTPEQKARIEKELKEEVAKIADETVKSYYVQDVKNKIYSELIEKQRPQRPKTQFVSQKNKPHSLARTIKTDLDDLVAKYIVSAFVCFPQLVEEYEERLLDFSVKDEGLRRVYETILEIVREDDEIREEAKLVQILEEKGFGALLKEKIDTRVLKRQSPDIIKMRKDLDGRIIEVQLKQLEADIRECKRLLESGNFNDDDYLRYEALKKERNALLQESEAF